MNDDQALAFVKIATAHEDRAFDAVLDMVRARPVPGTDPAGYDPDFVACEAAVFFLIMQERKTRDLDGWPPAVRDHETARTDRMRERLRERFGEHFDGWYDRVRGQNPDLV